MLNHKNISFHCHEDLGRLFDAASQNWIACARDAIRRRKRFSVALSGGESPIPFFQTLSKGVPSSLWQKTHIFLVDERIVSSKNKLDSNSLTINRHLVSKISIPSRNVHLINISSQSPAQKARDYQNRIIRFFKYKGKTPQFDLMVLGLGQDGHIASIFPDTNIASMKDKIVAISRSPEIKYERLTLTLPVINRARRIFFIVYGAKKKEIIRNVLKSGAKYPVNRLNSPKGRIRFYVDNAAY